jgi:CheY-like chemotaxis protein
MASDLCRVLVVDDNCDAADSAAMLLRQWRHEALAVYSGAECLAAAKAFDPDVVLMDLGMPDKDGFAVKDELEKLLPGVRVIALSGFTQAHIVRRTRDAGFTTFLRKGGDPHEIKEAVDSACAIARQL